MRSRRPLTVSAVWPKSVRSALVEVAALAHWAVIYTVSSWARREWLTSWPEPASTSPPPPSDGC